MKKTYNINISGFGFVIDEDAYDVLNSYLSTLSQICDREGQKETAQDIEQRIAEIFNERFLQRGPIIISRRDVEEVIERMGSPEEIMGCETVKMNPGPGVGPQVPPAFTERPLRKRLYRDIDQKVLGGVCSGLGWYLGIDPVWIRIVMVLLAFLSGSTMAILYIVLWIVIPPAKSPYEKMQMMGMNSSMSNVGKVVRDSYRPGAPSGVSPIPMQNGRSGGGGSAIGRVVVMVFSILGLLIVGGLLLLLSLAFIGCSIALAVTPVANYMVEAKLILGCIVGGSLVVGLPLFLLFRALLSALTERRYAPLSIQQRLFILIPWLLGVAACIVCGILLGNYA